MKAQSISGSDNAEGSSRAFESLVRRRNREVVFLHSIRDEVEHVVWPGRRRDRVCHEITIDATPGVAEGIGAQREHQHEERHDGQHRPQNTEGDAHGTSRRDGITSMRRVRTASQVVGNGAERGDHQQHYSEVETPEKEVGVFEVEGEEEHERDQEQEDVICVNR